MTESIKETLRKRELELNELAAEVIQLRRTHSDLRDAAIRSEKRVKEVESQFDDLKQRLYAAEKSNEFMRGYLRRVQEDDVVNEELIAIGEPGGDQQMVPKRKSTQFPSPDDFMHPHSNDTFGVTYQERQKKAKHWITY